MIANYRLLPGWAVAPAAALLPPLEMLLGAAAACRRSEAMAGPWRRIALLGLFAAAMAINVGAAAPYRLRLRPVFPGADAELDAGGAQSGAGGAAVAVLGRHRRRCRMSAALTGVAAGLGFFLLYLLFNLFTRCPGPAAQRFA